MAANNSAVGRSLIQKGEERAALALLSAIWFPRIPEWPGTQKNPIRIGFKEWYKEIIEKANEVLALSGEFEMDCKAERKSETIRNWTCREVIFYVDKSLGNSHLLSMEEGSKIRKRYSSDVYEERRTLRLPMSEIIFVKNSTSSSWEIL